MQAGSSPTLGTLTATGGVRASYAAGTTNRAIPIAYGTVAADGTLLSGTPNIVVTKSVAGAY